MKPTEFGDDVSQCPLDLGDDDVFNSIDSPVSCLDHLVQSDERGLQGSQLHQQVDCLLIVCLGVGILEPFVAQNTNLHSLQLLTTFSQSGQLVGVSSVLVGLEHREVDAGHVVVLRLHFDLSLVNVLQDSLVEVASTRKLSLGQREGSLLHQFSHQLFGLNDFLQDAPELQLQRVGFLLQQPVTCLSSLQTTWSGK